MEEYRVYVEILKFETNNDFKFTNTIRQKKHYLISSKRHIEDPYKFILEYLKRTLENDADEIYIRICRKVGE